MTILKLCSTILNNRHAQVLANYNLVYHTSKWSINHDLTRTFGTDPSIDSLDKELKEIFQLRNTNISNWIIENKVQSLCSKYTESSFLDRQQILRVLASQYNVQHTSVLEMAQKLLSAERQNERQIFTYERNLKNILTPPYIWLFVIMGRLEYGVKFLVDLRTDVLELMVEGQDVDENFLFQQLSIALKDLFLQWFSVGFLHLERITWKSSCDILEKVSNYEAIHPIKNWLDLKRRVGPYRRCYIFTHPSMPREPIVLLHTALCDVIPDSVKGIQEAEARIVGDTEKQITFSEEDKFKIKSAIFYSISSTQKGLQGIELGNYLIQEVANEVAAEFPMVDQFSSLSPIPGFREWLLMKIKQDLRLIFTENESKAIQNNINTETISMELKRIFNNSLWINDTYFSELLKQPLLRTCAWYLYKEKRRKYALNTVANFHLRNGAVMWRINWMADPSPRGIANSCGIMVNYRYFLEETEKNSCNYIGNYFIKASDRVVTLASDAEKLMIKV